MTDATALIDSFTAAHAADSDEDLARALVHDAGQLADRMRAQGLTTDYKTSISDVVTEADRTAEAFVAGVLSALRPGDGLLGEEGASRASTSGRTWVIDPVDGTYNFTSGFSYYCSALALVEGDPLAPDALLFGAVHRPTPATTYFGGPGIPTTVNGEPVAPLTPRRMAETSLVTYLHPGTMNPGPVRDTWLAVAGQFATLRMFGAGSVDLSLVATGHAGAWIQRAGAVWDWWPGKALVEGAGGAARRVEAGGTAWLVAGSTAIVDEIAAAFAAVDAQ
ncbi:inositol monophosphatase family protein [Corynebacterium uterequi]|nr:inositol monophosphatase family protein [Corynebacterium uterequi]